MKRKKMPLFTSVCGWTAELLPDIDREAVENFWLNVASNLIKISEEIIMSRSTRTPPKSIKINDETFIRVSYSDHKMEIQFESADPNSMIQHAILRFKGKKLPLIITPTNPVVEEVVEANIKEIPEEVIEEEE